MVEPVSTAITSFLGTKALEIIGAAVKKHVQGHVENLLASGEKKLLGKKERDALELAYQNALGHAYTGLLEALGRVLELTGITFPQFVDYQVSVERFLTTEEVAEHLFETLRDLSDDQLPDPILLESEWRRLDGKPFPVPGVWIMAAANFRKSAKEKTFITPQLREILNAQNLDQIKSLQQKLLGVQVAVRHEQYVSRMLKKYAPVELAQFAPSYVDDPGALIIADIFEPQHVRENPPPVEITKDEFEKLLREGKIDRNDEQALIAMLEDGEGEEVAQRLKFQRASYAEQPVRPVLDVIKIPAGARGPKSQRNRLLVITGEPGSGKSTLLRYLLLGILDPPPDPADPTHLLPWTEGFTGEHEHFPLLIELRDYYYTCQQEDEVNCFLDYIQYLGEAHGYGIDAESLHKQLATGRSFVMFDGLDEIFDAKHRDEIMEQIVGFVETYPRARAIVTSRPHGYHERILRPAGFAHFRLQDLDRDQTAHFTRAWFHRVFPQSSKDADQRIDRVLDSIDRSPSVRWLAGNPLLLTIMCLIAREKELPRERARFYEQCIDVLVHQWDLNRHLEEEDLAFLDIDDKKDLLRRIAFHMQQSDAGLRGNFIGEQDLLSITQTWFEDNYEDYRGAKAKQAAQQMVDGLWKRNYLLCPRGPKLYGFLHRTFMEYFTAKEYVRLFQKTPDFKLEDLDAVFCQHGNEPEWSEVLRLICGEVGDEFADKLIRTLLTLKEFPTELLTEENQPNHLVLAIRCMGELRSLSKMGGLGVFALERSEEFFRGLYVANPGNEFLQDLTDSAGEIGGRWPVRATTSRDRLGVGAFATTGWAYYPEFRIAVTLDLDDAIMMASVPGEYPDCWYRVSAFQGLARWLPGNPTRQLLSQHAVQDEHYQPRTIALELLAGHEPWADAATRQLLSQRAVEDEHPTPRSKALELLAGHEPWADAATRQLLSQRAVEDEHPTPRSKALELLAGHEPWADAATCQLLSQRAVEDKDEDVRSKALELLAGYEPWADAATRQLLSQRAVEDTDKNVRSKALELLAGHELWGDAATRQLLSQRAVEDTDKNARSKALELLAGHEAWGDAATRQLLSQRAVEDKDEDVRSKALELLAAQESWAGHKDTQAARRRFIQECIRNAAAPEKRGAAACTWFATIGSSDPLADVKERVFSEDADGVSPFLDPREPVSDGHLATVAEEAGLNDDQLNQMVEEMNETLGWDIRKGLGALAGDE